MHAEASPATCRGVTPTPLAKTVWSQTPWGTSNSITEVSWAHAVSAAQCQQSTARHCPSLCVSLMMHTFNCIGAQAKQALRRRPDMRQA